LLENTMRGFAHGLILSVCMLLFAPRLDAQTWPVRPIRVVVNSTPGSGVDIVTRAVMPQLSEALGQTLVIDNRPGAGGNIGLEIIARSAPDGYTLLTSPGGGIVMAPHFGKLGVNVDKDIVPVSPTASLSIFLVVRSGLPVRSLADLIAYARANPGKLNFGSSGNGSSLHIAAEMLLRSANIQAVHVPFKGGALAVTALLGGQIDFFFDPGPALVHVRAEKLRALAVARSKRSVYFPDIPTMAEAGFDVDLELVQGVYAPARTPHAIVARLNREISRIMSSAEVRNVLAAIGGEVVSASAEEFTARQKRDRDRFGAFIRQANIQAQ
jgi:tripartite-type tricarboxylate transporter receptor subunit TctC